MLSRVANSIYWMNRYVERADNYARFMEVDFNLAMDLPPGIVDQQWRPLVVTTGDEKYFQEQYGDFTRDHVIDFLAFDQKNPNSICSCLLTARENARTVREIIPSEMWMQINEMSLMVRHVSKGPKATEKSLIKFFRDIKLSSHLFSGIMDSTFSRSEGWHFANAGRFIERADKTDRILDMKYYYLLPKVDDVGTPLDLLQWSALLKSVGAFEMYRKVYGKLDVGNIIRFLVLDRAFPRTMLYCLNQVEQSVFAIVGSQMTGFETKAQKEIGKLRSELEYTDLQDIFAIGLHEYLDQFQSKLNAVGSALAQTFFIDAVE